jgi:hypothetical protein
MPLPSWWLAAARPAEAGPDSLWHNLRAGLAAGAAAQPPPGPGLWVTPRQELDIAQPRPARADGIVAGELRDRAGPCEVPKNPRSRTYVHLAPSGGPLLYFGMPAAFVDTTAFWMKGRRAWLAVTGACLCTGSVIGGAGAILVWLWSGLAAAPLLLQTGDIAALNSALSFKSPIRLDGY